MYLYEEEDDRAYEEYEREKRKSDQAPEELGENFPAGHHPRYDKKRRKLSSQKEVV